MRPSTIWYTLKTGYQKYKKKLDVFHCIYSDHGSLYLSGRCILFTGNKCR